MQGGNSDSILTPFKANLVNLPQRGRTVPDKPAIAPLLVSADETARLLGISRSFLYENLLSAGGLYPNPLHFGKRSLWSMASLVAFVDAESKRQGVSS